jgi:dolichol-phosphate mannosyltransferase
MRFSFPGLVGGTGEYRFMDESRSLSLVIPAFNEAAGIAQAVKEADAALRQLVGDYEILVIDDGSSDGTAQVVGSLVAEYPRLRLLAHDKNRGYGAALRTGFQCARYEYVAFTDADCQFDLYDLSRLLRHTPTHPIVVGYRVGRQDSARRRFFSHGYNLLVRGLLGTGVRDCDCALKVFQRSALRRLHPETNGFFVNTELLTRARQLGMSVMEVGVRHRPRLRGRSKVSLLDIPRTLAALVPFWWSALLFPRFTARQAARASAGVRLLGFGLVATVAFLFFLTRLNGPLLEPDEARYAEIPRQMLTAGHVAIPILHGQPYYHKPPLLYWLVMASYTAFGVNDWAARLVPCVASFLTVLVSYFWASRTIGMRTALTGAIILCLSARYVYLGRMLTMDGLLALWVVSAWATGHVAAQRATLAWGWWLFSAVLCGLGILTKGPVALVLIIVPLVLWQWLERRVARPRVAGWAGYLTMSVAVAAPWFIVVALRDGRFLTDFFWTHNVVRFVSPLDHEEPFWYFLPGLLAGMLPWTLLLPSLGMWIARRFGAQAARRPAGLGFVLLAGGWCLLFFSAGGCKRPGYILPAMPALAIALGCTLDALAPRHLLVRARTRTGLQQTRLAHRASLLVLMASVAIVITATLANLILPDLGLLLAAVALIVAMGLMYWGPLQRVATAWALCAAVTFGVLLVALHQLLPGYEHKFSLREQVRPQRDLPQTMEIPVVCYPRRWDSVSFYLSRDDVRVYGAENRRELIDDMRRRDSTLVFVKSDRENQYPLQDLLRDLPAWLEFVPHSRHAIVTVGTVQRRLEAPAAIVVQRGNPGNFPHR